MRRAIRPHARWQKGHIMSTSYRITAGNNSTDLGVVGTSDTLLGAKRLGRKAVRTMLPNGEGWYRVISPNNDWRGEAFGLCTGHKWLGIS